MKETKIKKKKPKVAKKELTTKADKTIKKMTEKANAKPSAKTIKVEKEKLVLNKKRVSRDDEKHDKKELIKVEKIKEEVKKEKDNVIKVTEKDILKTNNKTLQKSKETVNKQKEKTTGIGTKNPKRVAKKDVKQIYSLQELQEAMKSKQVFDVFVRDLDKDLNLIVVFANGISGIIPRSEISSIVSEEGTVESKYCISRKDKIMQVCIKDIKVEKDKIIQVILSRRILEVKVRTWMYSNLKPGMKLYGVVTGMTEYAAFVDVGGGVKALLKVEEISSTRVNKPDEKLRVGQRINCLVKKYDKDTGKIELSIKELEGSFADRTKNLKEGQLIDAIVRNRTKTGMFLEINGNITAMAEHVSGIEYGQKVLVHIKKISQEKERIRVDIIG